MWIHDHCDTAHLQGVDREGVFQVGMVPGKMSKRSERADMGLTSILWAVLAVKGNDDELN
jgi:hypothetical protein